MCTGSRGRVPRGAHQWRDLANTTGIFEIYDVVPCVQPKVGYVPRRSRGSRGRVAPAFALREARAREALRESACSAGGSHGLQRERADGRPGFSEPEEKGDSAFDKNAWFEERSQLVEKAKSLGLDYSAQSTNAQIAGAICQRTLSGTSVLERADSDASFAIGAALGATVSASAASSGRYIVKPTGKAVVDSSAVVMPVSWHDIKTKS